MIRNRNSGSILCLSVAMLATLSAGSAPAQSRTRTSRQLTTVSSGTVIPIKLDDPLNSKDVHQGDTFSATVTNVDQYSNATTLPVGTKVQGVVRSAQPMEGKNPGTLDIAFDRVTLPNGRSYSISGTPINLDSKSVTHKNGRIVAKSGRKGPNRLTYVGIGAGAGLLVNILGHRKGTLTDILIGAGLGYGAGALIKGGNSPRDVDLKAGTTMGVALTRNLAYAR